MEFKLEFKDLIAKNLKIKLSIRSLNAILNQWF